MSGVLDDMDGIGPSDIAERWFARLMAPDCTLREREQFEAWLAQSPENALAFEDTKALWAGLDGLATDEVLGPRAAAALLPDAPGFMGPWAAATQGLARRARPRAPRWRWPAAAGVAAVLVLGLCMLLAWRSQPAAVPYAAAATIASVRLADGSSVQLDLATAIDVRLGRARREVALRQGRAMFDVAKDAARPFVVDAGVGTVTAIGTHFQVQRQGDDVAVVLVEGAVVIASTAAEGGQRLLRLVPGQRAHYTPASGSWMVEATDAAAVTSWSHGLHVFEQTPLRQAVEEINRYSAVKLALADAQVGELTVSGSFKLGDGATAAQALPYALPVRVSQRSGTIVISRR